MAKIKAGDNVAYTPTKAESAIPTVDGRVLGEIISVEENSVVLKSNDGSFNVSKNPRRFTKLKGIASLNSLLKLADVEPEVADTVTVATKPGPKPVATKTKTIRPGSKKYRAIEIYQEVNGDETASEKLDRTTVKARFEAELELGTQGSSTYYQNIKARKNGWWF